MADNRCSLNVGCSVFKFLLPTSVPEPGSLGVEAVDDAFQKINVDMTKQHARAQMRTQKNIGDEAWIGP